MQRVDNPVIVPWFYRLPDAPFFPGSMQYFFIFYTISSTDLSIILQHHIKKLSRKLLMIIKVQVGYSYWNTQ
jgi:hypothetical protein